MPIYEYRCGNCGNKFDCLSKPGDIDIVTICGYCGVEDYHEPLISKSRFKFVGGLPSYKEDYSTWMDEVDEDCHSESDYVNGYDWSK